MRFPHYTPHKDQQKPGHRAEIRQRTVKQFEVIEWAVFIDEPLINSWIYHSERADAGLVEIGECILRLIGDGWIEDVAMVTQ